MNGQQLFDVAWMTFWFLNALAILTTVSYLW